jgi:nitrogen fixation-related uncharacterized protein
MSNLAIFVLGLVVTAIVAVAIAPLLWAAVLDGRYDREQRRLAAVPDERRPPGPRAA